MAIYRVVRYLDLFITFTCNPKWPKIKYVLKELGDIVKESRIIIVCRVFKIRLFELMNDLKQRNYFRKIVASKYAMDHYNFILYQVQ